MSQVSDARVVALNGSQDTTLHTGTTYFHGYTVRETAGNPAVLRIRVGTNTGAILRTISLAANGSTSEEFHEGLLANAALVEDWVSGAYEGSVFVSNF